MIWSAAPIENDGRRAQKGIIRALIDGHIDPDLLTVRSSAPRQVELVTFRGEGELLISAVDLLCTDELLPVPDFTVAVRGEKPKQITRLGGRDGADTAIPFTYQDGRAVFEVENLIMFAMYRIEW